MKTLSNTGQCFQTPKNDYSLINSLIPNIFLFHILLVDIGGLDINSWLSQQKLRPVVLEAEPLYTVP